ncbi:MAG: aminotransferase class I/II-fold pyridoxal phosphate-dependent enzyme [Alphaproteobacteria bacterium]|nr:aminotransferase class I/II-fold pyridoxal phosphate-dependent enzyme [Alphaproteobacteria bacterium]
MTISRRAQIDAFLAMDVMARANERARSGKAVFHLETGQPGCHAPKKALEAAAAALGSDSLGYTEALGRPALRKRIAEHYGETYGLDVPASRVIVTTGSSAGFILAFLAAFDAGDRLAMAVPGYPAYRNTAKALDLEPVFIRCGPEERFHLGAEALNRSNQWHGALIASPGNPTGTMMSRAEIAEIADVCASRKAWLISDEIYHGITYGVQAQTALSVAPGAIIINSFSKYYAMTGWRIGWMVVPEDLVRPIERLAQNLYISPSAISQIAAVAAMDAKQELDGHVTLYARNRKRLIEALLGAGVTTMAPADGAFYLYADVSRFGTSTQMAQRLLDEVGVAATPGLDFDPEEGDRWLRLSYAGSESEIAAAADAFLAWSKVQAR